MISIRMANPFGFRASHDGIGDAAPADQAAVGDTPNNCV